MKNDDDLDKFVGNVFKFSPGQFSSPVSNMNLMEIRAKASRLKQRHNLKLLVIDYLQLMKSTK